jgi:hypothetical protein
MGIVDVTAYLEQEGNAKALAGWVLRSNHGLAVNARLAMHTQAVQDPSLSQLKMAIRHILNLDDDTLAEMIDILTTHNA